jgi:hypothetical protein
VANDMHSNHPNRTDNAALSVLWTRYLVKTHFSALVMSSVSYENEPSSHRMATKYGNYQLPREFRNERWHLFSKLNSAADSSLTLYSLQI